MMKVTRRRTKRRAGRHRVTACPTTLPAGSAQPLGIHLDEWESRIIKTEKGVVRLLPVTERAKQLFGESGVTAAADEMDAVSNASPQLSLFPEDAPPVRGRARRRAKVGDGGD